MFGGAEDGNVRNDLWKYTVDTTCFGSLYCNETATGIQNITVNANISIYPNPSVGNWQSAVGNDLLGAQEEVLDINGRLLYQTEINTLHSEIPAPPAAGVYLLRITSNTGQFIQKLIKL